MECIRCGAVNSRVTDTRRPGDVCSLANNTELLLGKLKEKEPKEWRARTRQCRVCKHRFSTIEISMKEFKFLTQTKS